MTIKYIFSMLGSCKLIVIDGLSCGSDKYVCPVVFSSHLLFASFSVYVDSTV